MAKVTGCEDYIPKKYFEPNVNYEDDPNTLVHSMKFLPKFKKTPLDFALSRYLSVEKGLALMPLSCFCAQESDCYTDQYVRIAICRESKDFLNPELIKRVSEL